MQERPPAQAPAQELAPVLALVLVQEQELALASVLLVLVRVPVLLLCETSMPALPPALLQPALPPSAFLQLQAALLEDLLVDLLERMALLEQVLPPLEGQLGRL